MAYPVKYAGISYVKYMTVEEVRQLKEIVVIHSSQHEPLAVLMPYEEYCRIKRRTKELHEQYDALHRVS